jgi:TolA-binding protein
MTLAELAAGKYTLAMLLDQADKTATAEEYCRFIVKTYPGTAGATQAQAYLDKAFEQ